MALKRSKQHNRWKKGFILLSSVNMLILGIIIILLFSPIPEVENEPKKENQTQESSQFIVRTTKQNLNHVVNAYLEKLLADTNHHYSIHLDEDVTLLGELPFFSTTVPLLIHLEPIVQENGDVILKQKSISVGKLQVPNKKMMQYVSNYLPVPDWVVIHPDKEEIYVKVTEMDIQSNFNIHVEQFDLVGNNISFKIYVPLETLR